MLLRYKLFILCLLLNSSVVRSEVIKDDQAWINLNSFIKINDQWQAYLEVQPRWITGREYLGTTLYRAALDRKIGHGFSMALGYGFIEFTNPRYFHEDRPFLQLMHVMDFGKWKMINRTRLEGRYFRGTVHPAIRARHLLRGIYSLAERWRIVAWNEWFWNGNSTQNSSHSYTIREGFDQNRFFLGLGYALGKDGQHLVELGYMNQYVNGLRFDRSNNVISSQFTFRF